MTPGAPAAEASTVARRSPVSQSPIRLYALPVVLFTLGLFFQLVVLPSSFTASHYEVLGVVESASVDDVVGAYEKLSSKWSAGLDIPTAANFIKIRYAFELLTNPLLKRDYDIFGVDEQLHIIETLTKQYDGKHFSQVHIPLLNVSLSDSVEKAEGKLTAEDFFSRIGKNETWLIQVYSAGSHRCANFSKAWKRISNLLDGVANTGIVELDEVEFASFLAERRSTGQPFFRKGLPALVAFSPNCRSSQCYTRYDGDLSVDAIIDWIATSILGLPRILYYSRETVVQNFIAKSGQHKNKIIFFSKTGERAAPYLRQTAKDYWAYAAFAFVLWKEEESSVWWNTLGVESAPAVVVLKDPGVKPIVYHVLGSFHRSWFVNIMEENKHQDLPQLRSITSMELGCDARGHSRAGNNSLTWYCVVVAGRPSFQLNTMRETLRSVRKILLNDAELDFAHGNALQFPLSAADALKENRLTFTWLDGEAQSKYCFFYLYSEDSYETCGPRRHGDPIDVPKLFIVRYKRNSTESTLRPKKKVKSIWDRFEDEDVNLASQLVARYNGSDNLYEVIQWISQIIDDGDNRNLPYFRARTPELVPEDKDPAWPNAWHAVLRGWSLKTKLQDILQNVYSHTADPRLATSRFSQGMKMGSAPFIFFCLSLLVSMSGADDAQGNRPFGHDRFELDGTIGAFKNELPQEELSSSSCSDVSGKVKDATDDDDGRRSDDLDTLTGMLRGILPPELEATLKSNKTCTTCHKILEEITNVLGDTDKQVTIISSLLKKCENQTIFDECKEFVFAYGPIVLNSLHKIVALDLCYTTGICSDPKNETSQNVNLKNDGNVEPNYQNQARKIFLPREYALRSK